MSLLRKTMQASLMKNRFFSSAVIAAESPKITIARHLLLLKKDKIIEKEKLILKLK